MCVLSRFYHRDEGFKGVVERVGWEIERGERKMAILLGGGPRSRDHEKFLSMASCDLDKAIRESSLPCLAISFTFTVPGT